eukprot:CAMPEP_0198653954 /NCGR_PEP_ID=MMETSP1467-20131203/7391_1 /TAXON_ID=1462469 /ORGANISM="unid. sp., Strain CCMP2135" /LENGTH=594 /DNA_ID=CAMNT_0044389931 /DNA_START=1 /DNA_END=1785 /DNA_ORIENTATION=+
MKRRQQSMTSGAMMRGANSTASSFTPSVAQFSAPRTVEEDPYGPFRSSTRYSTPGVVPMGGPNAQREVAHAGPGQLDFSPPRKQQQPRNNKDPTSSQDWVWVQEQQQHGNRDKQQRATSVYTEDAGLYERPLTSRREKDGDDGTSDRTPQKNARRRPSKQHQEDRRRRDDEDRYSSENSSRNNRRGSRHSDDDYDDNNARRPRVSDRGGPNRGERYPNKGEERWAAYDDRYDDNRSYDDDDDDKKGRPRFASRDGSARSDVGQYDRVADVAADAKATTTTCSSSSQHQQRYDDSPKLQQDDSSYGQQHNDALSAPLAPETVEDAGAASKTPPAPEFDITALPLHDMRTFLTRPCPRAAGIVQCYIKRNRSGTNKLFPEYAVHMKAGDRFLMCSKKRPNNKTSNYLISMGENDLKRTSSNYIGKLRANFAGTEFQIFDAGSRGGFDADDEKRSELGAVIYTSNVLGSRGPRKMQVAIPKVDGDDSTTADFKDDAKSGDVLSTMKAHDYGKLIYTINKPPRWNEQVGAYVLNFNGRVTMASVKNFQLVQPDEQDAIFLQFGRVGKDLFTMDFQYPMSPFQAFAITLSSFDSKIACD